MLGQHVVLSLPLSEKGGRGAGCWQANGRDAVAPLPKAEPFPIRQTLTAIRLGQHVVLSLPEAVEKGDRGAESWRGGAATVLRTLYSELYTLLLLSLPYASQKRQIMTMAAVSSWQ